MKLKRMKQVSLVFVVLTLVLTLFSATASAAKGKTYANGALTPPPPDSDKYTTVVNNTSPSSPGTMSTMSTYQYLGLATNTISNPSSGVGGMLAQTGANTIVDSIYVSMKMQRWTGSQWIDIYYSGTSVNYNTAQVSRSDACTVLSGYYYRIVSDHWLYYGSTYESTTVYGYYQLMG